MVWQHDGDKNLNIICLFVSTEFTNATEAHCIGSACIVSSGKKAQ